MYKVEYFPRDCINEYSLDTRFLWLFCLEASVKILIEIYLLCLILAGLGLLHCEDSATQETRKKGALYVHGLSLTVEK